MEAATRFVELACLTYDGRESRARRVEAVQLLEAEPDLVRASPYAAAAAGDLDALQTRAGDPSRALLALCYSRVPQRDPLGTLDLLLARGADPNAHDMRDGCRFTALTGVMGEGEAGPFEQPPHPQAHVLAERLLDAGADPDESQGLYNTHFRPSNAWLELLLAGGLSSPDDLAFLLGQAALQGFVERVRLLLARGVPAEGRNRYNHRTHAENAVLEGHDEIAKLLVAAGACEPVLDDEVRFRVALFAAARHGRVAKARQALDRGAPIDAIDRDGLTALHHAARNGHLAVVQLLVERGARLDIRDPLYVGTALGHARHFAERWGRGQAADVVAFLSDRAG